MSLDRNGMSLRPGIHVKLHNGAYSGFRAKVVEANGSQVTVQVPGDPPATVQLNSMYIERIFPEPQTP